MIHPIYEGISEYKPDVWIPLPRVAATDSPQPRRAAAARGVGAAVLSAPLEFVEG